MKLLRKIVWFKAIMDIVAMSYPSKKHVPVLAKTQILFGALAISMLLISGCASIISGKTQEVSFDSNPSQADVYVDGAKVCTTPCTAVLRRSHTAPLAAFVGKRPAPKVEIKKGGYETVNVPIVGRMNYWFFANALWVYSATTAFAVDYIQDDPMYQYDPDRYLITLPPAKGKGSKLDDKTKEQAKVLVFIVMNRDKLITNISNGTGEYLLALYELIGVKKDKQTDALSKLRSLQAQYTDTMQYARAVYDALCILKG